MIFLFNINHKKLKYQHVVMSFIIIIINGFHKQSMYIHNIIFEEHITQGNSKNDNNDDVAF